MILIIVILALLKSLLILPNCFDPTERCLNGGMCMEQSTNETHSAVCTCSAGYSGEKCEKKIVDICKTFPHYCNAGTCVNVNGSAICHCSMGYSGQNCEYTFDKCNFGNICRNGGTCVDDLCFCIDGFSGEVCERHVPERDDYLRAGCEEHPEFCALRFADATCNEECNNEKCFFDGFDCVKSTQECRFADYCALHYLDGKCDEKCAVAECGYDGMDCDRNMFFHSLTESNTIGIIFDGSPTKVLDKIYSLLAKLAQKLHSPVYFALDNNNNKARIYEWLFENGAGKEINLKEQWKISRNSTGVLLYVNIDLTFCEQRLHLSKTNVLPCFTDIFSAAAYLHTALYDEVIFGFQGKDRISLGDVTVERLFIENGRTVSIKNRFFPVIAILITCFILVVIILSYFCGIYGFYDVLKKRNIGKNHAPVWKIPHSLQNNAIDRSKPSSVEDSLFSENACQQDGLPSQPEDLMNYCQLTENNEQKILVNLDAYFSDNDTYCHLGPDLLKAIKCNDIKSVSFLVRHGADVNCSDSDNNTALHHAVIVNNDQIIRLLLNTHRCNLRATNILGQIPLTLTVKFTHVSDQCACCILDFLYAEHFCQTKSLNGTFVPQASLPQNGLSQSVFAMSGNVQQFDPSLKQAGSYFDDYDFSHEILSEKNDPTLIDIFGRTPLHYAALNRRVNLLLLLYRFGLELNTKDSKGETPLYLAAREGHLDVVDLLLSSGAKSKISDQLGRTPLDVANERGHYLVVEFLENVAVNNVDTVETPRRKRNRKSSSAAKCKWRKEFQASISSQETVPLNSSSIMIRWNEDYKEDIGNIDEDLAMSNSFLDSVESFVLTPPEQILAEAEKELDLNVINSAVPDYIDLTTNPLPSEFFNDPCFMESFQFYAFNVQL
ncbi:hypothetical protein X798_02013 [Onchocerca flexuosa]|uniref:EGF-like domain protein n=1 Tax=Onchocerca flexuosa TaxID=387005 RepID=A0A238C089_9BILA|nr:hypothetical protein X798_02013 [Onchocerca flexuosa]